MSQPFDRLTISDLGKRITGAVPRGAAVVTSTVVVMNGEAIFQTVETAKIEAKHTNDVQALLVYVLRQLAGQPVPTQPCPYDNVDYDRIVKRVLEELKGEPTGQP